MLDLHGEKKTSAHIASSSIYAALLSVICSHLSSVWHLNLCQTGQELLGVGPLRLWGSHHKDKRRKPEGEGKRVVTQLLSQAAPSPVSLSLSALPHLLRIQEPVRITSTSWKCIWTALRSGSVGHVPHVAALGSLPVASPKARACVSQRCGGVATHDVQLVHPHPLGCQVTASARPNLKKPIKPKFRKTCPIPHSQVLSGNSSYISLAKVLKVPTTQLQEGLLVFHGNSCFGSASAIGKLALFFRGSLVTKLTTATNLMKLFRAGPVKSSSGPPVIVTADWNSESLSSHSKMEFWQL